MEIDNQNQNISPQNQPPVQGQGFPPQQPQLQNQQPSPQMPGQAQQNQTQIPGQPQQIDQDPGKGIGIASLVLGILGMSLISLPLGIVARKKSRSVGKNNIPALIGIILSILNMVAVVGIILFTIPAFNNAQNGAKESEMSSIIVQSQAKAEEFYATNGQYPKDIVELRSYMSTYGSEYTASKLLGFDGLVTYTAYESDNTTVCTGQNLDCQTFRIVGDASYWNGDADIVKTNR